MNIAPGTIWKHHEGNKYKILKLALTTGPAFDERIVIVYEPWPVTEEMVFVRPISDWCSNVAKPEEKRKSRFEYYAKDEEAARARP